VKFENELSTLKDKNTQILNERRRYTIQFYSKYSQLVKENPANQNAGSPNRHGGPHRNIGHSNKKIKHTNKDGSITVYIIG
jgi:hypothetical protein